MTPLRSQIKRVSETKGLTIKQIVNICECSRSHFYKVLDGQRLPSESLQAKLMEVLEIKEAEFDLLLQESKKETNRRPAEEKAKNDGWQKALINRLTSFIKTKYSIFLLSLICMLIVPFDFYFDNSDNVSKDLPLKTGFATKFIKDVTIPDGSPIPVNTEFTKIWRIQNVGTLAWKDKRLVRMTPHDPNLCYSVDSIELPTVKPGEIIDISIEFKTPRHPGTCRTDWKMMGADGRLTFPGIQGLYSIVHVVAVHI